LARALLAVPRAAALALYRSLRRRPFVQLRIHGADLLGEADGIAAVPGLPRGSSQESRTQRLGELLSWLRDDFELMTLQEASARLAPFL
jgi:hypothetical protein